jgi:hypothetical protein
MNIKVVKKILKKLPQFIFVSIFCTVSLSGFAQGQIFGEFSIQFSQSWIYDGAKSTTDYFVFINGEAGLELVLKKNSVPCANPQEFNKQILPVIQDFQKAQWIIEQRKPSAPYSFAGQAGIHVMKLKSRASGQQKFILNPVVKGKMYQLEISSATTSIEMPAAAIDFVSRISTSDSQATAVKQEDLQGTQGKANDVFISVAENKPNPGSAVNNDVSGISKVKSPEYNAQNAGASALGTKSDPQNISAGATAQGVSGNFDPVLSDKASSMPDGDELPAYIRQAGTPAEIGSDAGWAAGLARNPKAFLDALEGGRPGGDVSALMALLRQSQGPFDEAEEKSMMSQYAAHSATGSPKAHNGIRSQSEHLLKAMIERELMMQAAREYDNALVQSEVAGMMEDEDEKQITSMLAEVQKMMIEQSQSSIEAEVKASESSEPVPTQEEVTRELTNERENAEMVVQAICGTPDDASPEKKPVPDKAAKDQGDGTDAMVGRYFELREEHRMLTESCKGGSDQACKEATSVYREAMDLRKKLEAKGIDVLNYKKPENKNPQGQTTAATSNYTEEPLIKPSKPDPSLTQIQNEAIGEHEANIQSTQRTLNSIRKEMAGEQNVVRREELRLQALHMEQNIHDSKDLIESVRTGQIVKTRGPWDEHAAVVLAETGRKLREDFQRANQMQASYIRMLNVLNKYNPQEAERLRKTMGNSLVKGIFDPGGFARAQQSIDALYSATKGVTNAEQNKLIAQQDKSKAYLEMVERHLGYAETLKSGCDKAIFVGTLFTGMAPGLILSMVYEGATTGIEKGPKEALKNMAIQGTAMVTMAGLMKAGSWSLGKFLNPKVAQGEVNTFKNLLEANKYKQEMEWNKALVNQFKEKATAFEKCKATGGKNYVEIKKVLDESVSAVNSSSLAKRIMKNELSVLQNEIKSGATRDYSKLKEVLNSQKIFDNRLQKSIYPRTDAAMVSKLKSQGYNVESSWFQEYRNACSSGVNADRDLGLMAQYEKMLRKNGQPVSTGQFMDEAQKIYNESYKAVTGRSAKLADQSITTSQHSESFPVSWLQKKVQGPFSTLDPPVSPRDFEKAGNAIYNKVNNALTGPDPAFANMKKAAASLSKDLKSKVFERLKNPPLKNNVSASSRQGALQHWEKVQQALDDFATDKCDPLTTMRKLQQLTGSTSIAQSAQEVRRLLNNLGGIR